MRHDFIDTALIDKTIRSIRHGDLDMVRWDRCICGHIARVLGRSNPTGIFDASHALHLSDPDRYDLFCSELDATKEQAIRVLEILRDEGVIDWVRAKAEVA
jgi:hypothetical protein